MATGTVKWVHADKGYGFLVPDDGGEDLFVHYSAVRMTGRKTLTVGQKVEYDVTQGSRGPQAGNVRVIGTPASEHPDELT